MKYFLLTLIAAFSSLAFAETPWCHETFTLQDGTTVSIDYQTSGQLGRSGVYEVGPLWFNVRTPSPDYEGYQIALTQVPFYVGSDAVTTWISLNQDHNDSLHYTAATSITTSLNEGQTFFVTRNAVHLRGQNGELDWTLHFADGFITFDGHPGQCVAN